MHCRRVLSCFNLARRRFRRTITPGLIIALIRAKIGVPRILPASTSIASTGAVEAAGTGAAGVASGANSMGRNFCCSAAGSNSVCLNHCSFGTLGTVGTGLSLLGSPQGVITIGFSAVSTVRNRIATSCFGGCSMEDDSTGLYRLYKARAVGSRRL